MIERRAVRGAPLGSIRRPQPPNAPRTRDELLLLAWLLREDEEPAS